MIEVNGLELPETHEELLVAQLEHAGNFGAMIGSLFCKTSRENQHAESAIISDWMCQQKLIKFSFKYSRSNGNIHMRPAGETRWHIISKRHHNWFYKLSSYVTTTIAYEYV